MSYDLGVWHAARPMTTEEAGQVYLKLCDGDVSQVQAHPSVASFLAELTRTYPEIDDWDEADIESCPWSIAFDKSDRHVLMCMAYSRADEIVPFVESLARKHGLVCFNPQGPR